ncbi:MAG: hypothetical protein L6Q38_16765, partial [Nitrospira sp.]|nr:hypothetical protein [Nitrospira sp.]
RREVAQARVEVGDLEGQKGEHQKNITASRNIVDAARKFMQDSLARARSFAQQMGVKNINANDPWNMSTGGIKITQDNREQIRKEMAAYNKQKIDLDKATRQRSESERALQGLDAKISTAKARLEKAQKALRALGADVEAPGRE